MTAGILSSMRARSARVIGLTGGIGSGKSAVSQELARRGMTVVDADALTRIVHCDPDICTKLADIFGADVIGKLPGGSVCVDRSVLARRAFDGADGAARLNSVMHPALTAAAKREIARAEGRVVLDAPLLIEAGWHELTEIVVVVMCPAALRIDRVRRRDGLDASHILRRMSAQIDDSTRCRCADLIIYNTGDIAALYRQIDHIWGPQA